MISIVAFSLLSPDTSAKGAIHVVNDTDEAIQVRYQANYGSKILSISSNTTLNISQPFFHDRRKYIGILGYPDTKVQTGQTIKVSNLKELEGDIVIPSGYTVIKNDTDKVITFQLFTKDYWWNSVVHASTLKGGESRAFNTPLILWRGTSECCTQSVKNCIQIDGYARKTKLNGGIVTISELLACKKEACESNQENESESCSNECD